MKSPFPGMDPYLEQNWGEVHTSLIVYARNQLNSQLLVEIDLVRQGSYVLAAPDEMIPEHLRTSYLVCVYRKEKPDQVEVFRVPLRERLPNIPIPLRLGEPDAVLQFQPLIDDCYRDGRHHRTNYRVEPKPPLIKEDADWADAVLREQGYRT
jgi:hypothetical protein